MFCGRKKAQKVFPPKLNWKTLANCVDKYFNSQTETMESELPACEFEYGKYLIVPFWYASAAYQPRLDSPWVFWLDCVPPKYEPWLDQTRLICRRSVPKRYDWVYRTGELINKKHIWRGVLTGSGSITILCSDNFESTSLINWLSSSFCNARIEARKPKIEVKLKHEPPALVNEFYELQLVVESLEETPVKDLR